MISTIILACVLAPFTVVGLAAVSKVAVTLLGNGKELQES